MSKKFQKVIIKEPQAGQGETERRGGIRGSSRRKD